MTISLVHAKVSPIPDDGDPNIIQPSDWNDEHELTVAQDRILGRISTGTGAVEEIACTAFARSILDDADAATACTTLGLVIGTNVQAWDADLDSWAAVSRAAGFDTFAATPSSANLRSLLTDETGTGAAMFGTSPSITTDIRPASNDGASLGISGTAFSDVFLASGGVIDWNTGDVLLTHSANALSYSGGDLHMFPSDPTRILSFYNSTYYITANDGLELGSNDIINFKTLGTSRARIGAAGFYPSSNDGIPLGVSGQAFSDLFLATGGVIDFGTGDVTITHSSNALTIAGGAVEFSSRPTFSGSNILAASDIGATVQAYDADLDTWAAVSRAAGFDTFAATPSLANFGSLLTGEGTGVITALGVNVGTAGAFVVNGGDLGTPSSGTLTNCTGLPVAGGGTGATTAEDARAALQAASFDAGAALGLLINPFFEISQENGTTAGAAATAYYAADQWYALESSDAVLSVQNVTTPFSSTATLKRLQNSIKATATTADGTIAAAQYIQPCVQVVEGTFWRSLGWGTADARAVDVVVIAQCSVTGTYPVAITNAAGNRAYCATISLTANTPTVCFVTIPGDTGGTWVTTTAASAKLFIGAVGGSDYQVSSLSTWEATGNFTHSSCTNWAASGTTNFFQVAHAQIFPAGVLPFTSAAQITGEALQLLLNMRRPFEVERLCCERYFQSDTAGALWCGQTVNSQTYYSWNAFRTTMRTNPAIALASSNNSNFPATPSTVSTAFSTGFYSYRAANATANMGLFSDSFSASARM